MSLIELDPRGCAAIAIDCLNTFMRSDGALSISRYQHASCGLDQGEVQRALNGTAARIARLRRALYEAGIPQVQLQDAHVAEEVHGRRFHSMELVRQGEEPDFVRTFPVHALLDRDRRYGSPDQQAIDEIRLPALRPVLIHWFASSLPAEARLSIDRELIFMKDDFCATPGNPYIRHLFWELRCQARFTLIIFGVCDEICNLRNVMLFLASFFKIIYVPDCTFPLSPEKREVTLDYLERFNAFTAGGEPRVQLISSVQLISALHR